MRAGVGHDGGTPSTVSISLSSPDGSQQAGMAATSDQNPWSEEIAGRVEAWVLGGGGPRVAVREDELPRRLS